MLVFFTYVVNKLSLILGYKLFLTFYSLIVSEEDKEIIIDSVVRDET